jgi:hypothetical protein
MEFVDYDTYMGPIKKGLADLVRTFGTDAVYNQVPSIGGQQERRGRSRIVYIPADSDKRKTVFLEISTAKTGKKIPLFKSLEATSITSVGYSGIPAAKRQEYQRNILANIERMKQQLGCNNTTSCKDDF